MLKTQRICFVINVLLAVTIVASTTSLQAQSAPPLNDPTIVAIFDAANTWDIETGSLAAKRGTTAEVRAFGKMLVRDHTAVRKLGRDLARKLGVTPTPPKNFAMEKDHVETMRKLKAATTAEFDRMFLSLDVAYHTAVIGAVESTLLPAAQNKEFKDLVTSVVPAFKGHRDAGQQLLDKINKR